MLRERRGHCFKVTSRACACIPITYGTKIACMMPRTGLCGAGSTVAEWRAIVHCTDAHPPQAGLLDTRTRFRGTHKYILKYVETQNQCGARAQAAHALYQLKIPPMFEASTRTIGATTSSTQEVSGSPACPQSSRKEVTPTLIHAKAL